MEDLPKTRLEPIVPTVHLSQCKLVILRGPQRGREFIIARDVIRVGKNEDNDLVLTEETVSRVHFEIVRDAKGYLLRDLHSTNGTFLDGAEIREAYLRPGSVITAGTVQLKFQPYEERIEILPSEKESFGPLLGRSLRMREIFGLLERIAPTEATVLIEGETGTGKDLVAHTIHQHSRRREGPFIVVDCGAVAPNLIESELFGHEKGAFTGATTTRQGAFELAHTGTLFLDELDELPLDLQPKLLRVLEQREIRRVGGSRTLKVDIRVIAATKHDLRREVERGKFREDLFFRLSVVPVRLPPLRERKEDLPLLARSFLSRIAGEGGQVPQLDDRFLNMLMAHDWPGNIRELRNVIERGVVLGEPRLIDMPSSGHSDHAAEPMPEFDANLSYRQNKERWEDAFERRYLRWLMLRSDRNISRAAREADMDRKYLHKLLKKHHLVS
ncbi:MAG: sigma 54-interacting transcriptional regulator [Myxococcales bacterium]|nr:sigma 54-interacting transcriptional regulator [Myxococcota bacterium]MDW8283474.1 sigma 54-interacting transcriptional regulator [Myxococcales bacterium]